MKNVSVNEITRDRGKICDDLLRSLPLWFGIESGIQKYVSDVEGMPTFVVHADDKPIGLASLNLHNEYTAELHVIAVHPEFHRKGIGRLLVETVEAYLRNLNYRFLSVKTVSPTRPSREYEQTRRFYFAMGFRPVEEFRTLWGEANPCMLMIKSL